MDETLRITFCGGSVPGSSQERTQASMVKVRSAELHKSGQWLITVSSKSGQVAIVRISPETQMIVIDKERLSDD